MAKYRNLVLIFLAVAAIAVTIAASYVLARPYQFHGAQFAPPVAAQDFTLADQNGQPFRLSDQRGKIVLIFFGYTHCADVCPATAFNFAKIRARLGEKANGVQFVFVTVDPERDSPDVLKAYLSKFDPAISGLTGNLPTLESVWQAYGVGVQADNSSQSGNGEVVHSSRIYLVDQAGDLRLTYLFPTPRDEIVQDIEHLLGE